MSLICLIRGHVWGDTTLDRAIATDWGVFTCKRCWHTLGQAPPYDEVAMMMRLTTPVPPKTISKEKG